MTPPLNCDSPSGFRTEEACTKGSCHLLKHLRLKVKHQVFLALMTWASQQITIGFTVSVWCLTVVSHHVLKIRFLKTMSNNHWQNIYWKAVRVAMMMFLSILLELLIFFFIDHFWEQNETNKKTNVIFGCIKHQNVIHHEGDSDSWDRTLETRCFPTELTDQHTHSATPWLLTSERPQQSQ